MCIFWGVVIHSNDQKTKLLRLLKKSKINLDSKESLNLDNFNTFIDLLERKFKDDQDKFDLTKRSLDESSKEIKEYLETIEQAQALALHSSKMAEVGSMASNISHEINNPLAVINGSNEIIQFYLKKLKSENKSLTSEDFTFLENQIETISKTTKKMGQIINGLKRVCHSSSNNTELTEEDLILLIEESFAFGMESLKKSRITLSFDKDVSTSKALINSVELSQVIVNLLTNAKQALEKLDDSHRKSIHIELIEQDSIFQIKITNSGPKIPDEIKGKIFNNYFTTKKVGEGSGIGLYISKRLIENMSGKLYLNEDFISPQFIIELPKNR